MLTVEEVAGHFGLKPDTVRARIKAGELHAVRINRRYRLDWADVWACEKGPMPRGARLERFKAPLLSKADVAQALNVSTRTVERWIEAGLPTRSVFSAVRMNPEDVTDWLKERMDLDLDQDWWLR